MICEILGVFVNLSIANDKYILRNSQTLLQPIQMQLSKREKGFSNCFAPFLKSTSDFKHFEKKDDPHRLCFSEKQTAKGVVRQMSKKPCFRTPFESQHVKGSQMLAKSA